jgi:hypothetical protein
MAGGFWKFFREIIGKYSDLPHILGIVSLLLTLLRKPFRPVVKTRQSSIPRKLTAAL